MEGAVKISFYTRPRRKNDQGLVPLFMRVSINGVRVDKSVRQVDPKLCVLKSGQLIRKSRGTDEIHDFIEALKMKAYSIEKNFMRLERPLTLDLFEREWNGTREKIPMLLEIFREHNMKLKQLVGADFSDATRKKYETSLRWRFRA